MPLELEKFLLTGQIEGIWCGMSREDVLNRFGEPPQKVIFDKCHGFFKEERFFYDALTFFFQNEAVSLYGLWMEDNERIPTFLEPTGYFPLGGKVPMADFLNYLKAENIPFRDRQSEESDMHRTFTKGEVAIGGYTHVLSLVVPCPGTERWRTIHGPQIRVGPPRPFPFR